jgi:hypothetical protein
MSLFDDVLVHPTAVPPVPLNPVLHAPLRRYQSTTRSCVRCGHRKVRCDKLLPCAHCRKSGTPCVFPGPRRGIKNVQTPANDQVQGRLVQLEGLVKDLCEKSSGLSAQNHHTDRQSRHRALVNYRRPFGQETGRLVTSKGASRYVSSTFWVALSDHVRVLHVHRNGGRANAYENNRSQNCERSYPRTIPLLRSRVTTPFFCLLRSTCFSSRYTCPM